MSHGAMERQLWNGHHIGSCCFASQNHECVLLRFSHIYIHDLLAMVSQVSPQPGCCKVQLQQIHPAAAGVTPRDSSPRVASPSSTSMFGQVGATAMQLDCCPGACMSRYSWPAWFFQGYRLAANSSSTILLDVC